MVSFDPSGGSQRPTTLGIDRTMLRLALLGVLVMAAFVALFSRLWFLQVLAAEDYRQLAKENRVRLVHSEPPRGRILDRNGRVIVDNRSSLAITIDRQIVDTKRKERRVLGRISRLLDVPVRRLRENLQTETVSPYKPVPIATDVREEITYPIAENREDFPGVGVEKLPVRTYPRGGVLAQVLGYVNEISPEQLESAHFRGGRRPYGPGDNVGQTGVEYTYDRVLRGVPRVDRVIVNSVGRVVDSDEVTEERKGNDLVLAVDLGIQRITERALRNGIRSARAAGYEAPAGGVVVMDPNDGGVVAMASFPTYDPSILADGISDKEWLVTLGNGTATNDDDATYNRVTQGEFPPGSIFKVVTAGAAMWSGVSDFTDHRSCPPALEYGNVVFRNWSSIDYGLIDYPRSLEISCDTFYYQLGWDMEERYGAANGDGSERFQRYMRLAGFGHPTGLDLPFEKGGVVPDERWCEEGQREISPDWCYGTNWLPGYTVNMSIGQGDLKVTPLQMAVTYAAIANGGKVLRPHFGLAVRGVDEAGDDRTIRRFKPKVVRKLPLSSIEIDTMHRGLVDVVSAADGTARYAFSGFPLARYPLAGKTGTAEIGDTDKNYAWFVSYGPVDSPEYVIAVYVERAGHGGESAAPIAREIWEAIFGVDKETQVQLGQDASG